MCRPDDRDRAPGRCHWRAAQLSSAWAAVPCRSATGVATTVPLETRVVVPFWGTRYELVEVIELARSGAIRANVETFPLEEAPTAYERLEAGDIRGRAVVVPEST